MKVLKCGEHATYGYWPYLSFAAYMGLFQGILRFYNPTKSSSRAEFIRICSSLVMGMKQSLHVRLGKNLRCFSCRWSFFAIWGLYGPVLGYFQVLQPYRILLQTKITRNMVKFGYGNKIEPSYWTFKEFAIFFR